MLTMLFETGHPWFTFKDPINLRSPQDHVGVVHSSNLCTEITLNTSDQEIAVCNLGSVNLAAHVDENGIMVDKLEKTINTAMRMLDNVIDYNYYSVDKARNSNAKHRPVGLGLMGFQDALYKLSIPYASDDAIKFADQSMEYISYFAIKASTNLAEERGTYESYEGSLWSQGILPIDSIELLEQQRQKYISVDKSQNLDWSSLRDRIRSVGMQTRNHGNCTNSNDFKYNWSYTSIERHIKIYMKSNLSGEFTVINLSLVDDLKKRGLWDEVMVNDLKYFDGSLKTIDRIPDDLKELYSTAFELDARWLVEAASRRQKWMTKVNLLICIWRNHRDLSWITYISWLGLEA